MTSRISRGFHRIGLVLAVPLLLASAALAGNEWLQRTAPKSAPDPWAVIEAPAGSTTTTRPVPVTDPALLKALEAAPDDPPPVPPHIADYTASLLLLGLAVALYAAARALGWVVDGFTSPSRSRATE